MTDHDKQDWHRLALDLENTVDAACEQLKTLPDTTIEARDYAGAWSVKEVVGHLVNSATNNHQRFIRLQISDHLVFPDYSQDNDAWVSLQGYQETPWEDLLNLWRHFNHHLARVIRRVNHECLDNVWVIDQETTVCLGELMVDYLRHLKEHLTQIREKI